MKLKQLTLITAAAVCAMAPYVQANASTALAANPLGLGLMPIFLLWSMAGEIQRAAAQTQLSTLYFSPVTYNSINSKSDGMLHHQQVQLSEASAAVVTGLFQPGCLSITTEAKRNSEQTARNLHSALKATAGNLETDGDCTSQDQLTLVVSEGKPDTALSLINTEKPSDKVEINVHSGSMGVLTHRICALRDYAKMSFDQFYEAVGHCGNKLATESTKWRTHFRDALITDPAPQIGEIFIQANHTIPGQTA